MTIEKRYLGDAVYVDFDGHGFQLTTENGIRATNVIILEPETLAALNRYAEAVRAELSKRGAGG